MSDYTGLELFDGTLIPHYESDELQRVCTGTIIIPTITKEANLMSLYAIGDLHLSYHPNVTKTQEIFGENWINYQRKIDREWRECIKQDDTVVITGDLSWGKNMEEVLPDLDYIAALPGRKILIRGNHDFFWSVRKTSSLNQKYDGKMFFLQNNFGSYEDFALVGSKGYQNEDGKDSLEQSQKFLEKELKRLRISLETAKTAGYRDYIMFLHYPPAEVNEKSSAFIELAKEYSVTRIIYSHLHGTEKHNNSLRGVVDGIEYFLVSADYLNFKPQIIV